VITGTDVVPTGGRIVPWSFRHFDGVTAAVYVRLGRVRVRLWDASWILLADYDAGGAYPRTVVEDSPDFDPQLYGYYDPDFGASWILHFGDGSLNRGISIMSRYYAGVIPYADLESTSIGTALKELALISLSFVQVDHASRSVSIVARDTVGDPILDLGSHEPGAPIEMTERPQWEGYRTSVVVSGETQDGDSFDVVSGDSAARRIEISSKFASSESVGLAIASSYAELLGQLRRSMEVTIEETGTILRPFDVVRLDGIKWLVQEAETDLARRVQRLELIEVVE